MPVIFIVLQFPASSGIRGRENRLQDRVRHYATAGMTLRVASDLPITDATFTAKLAEFRVETAGSDTVAIRRHCGAPDLRPEVLGDLVRGRAPRAVCRGWESRSYLGIVPWTDDRTPGRLTGGSRTCVRWRTLAPQPLDSRKGHIHRWHSRAGEERIGPTQRVWD
jgi:hypothetical protein